MKRELDLSVNVAGIKLEHPLMNAAGTCKLLEGPEGIRELARSAAAAIMVGSITLKPREGNSGEVYWTSELCSLNSMGLPNPGAPYYQKHLPIMVNVAHKAGKPLFVNVAGFSPSEYADLTELAFRGGADLVEINLGCSNLYQDGRQKPAPCFDLQLTGEILYCVEKRVGPEAEIAVKISPFPDPSALSRVAQVFGQSKVVKVVATSDTFPNAFSYDEKGKSRISFGEGLAALGGRALKPIALGQVKQLRKMLLECIDIVGVGGITKGKDIKDYQRAGAVAVQIATTLLDKGARVFSSLLAEFLDISEKKGSKNESSNNQHQRS